MLNALPTWIAPSSPNAVHAPTAGTAPHGEDAAAARGGFADVLSQAKAPHEAYPVCKPAQPAKPARPEGSTPSPEPETPSDEPAPTNALPPKPASRGGASQGAKPRPATGAGKADKAHAAGPANDSETDPAGGATGKRRATTTDDATDALPIDPLVMQAAARAAAQDAKASTATAPAPSAISDTTAAQDGASASTPAPPTPAAGQDMATLEMTQDTSGESTAPVLPLAPATLASTLPAPAAPAQVRVDGSDNPISLASPRGPSHHPLGDAGPAAQSASGNAAPAPAPGAAATGAAIGAATTRELEAIAGANTPPQAAEGASANAQANPAAGLSFATGLADALAPKAGAHVAGTAEVRVPAAVNSPEFAPALGLTLSTLAANGVQEARLQLHPAELGPISVQISVDGTGARIDFQADVAQTRQAIEDSLPSLAGALRDAGLTLTGGGVSQHSRQPEQPASSGARGGARGASSARDDDVAAIGSTLSRNVQRRGLVDLLA